MHPFTYWGHFTTFLKNIDKHDYNGCWYWVGDKDDEGFGIFKVGIRTWMVHELSWKVFGGSPIPTGVTVTQACGNRLCASPKHLELKLELEYREDDPFDTWL